MKITTRITALFLAVFTCLTLFSCSNETTTPPADDTTLPADTTASAETTTPDTTEPVSTEFVLDENAPPVYDVVEKKLMRTILDWMRGKTTTESGELAYWDNQAAKVAKSNFINVFPTAMTPDFKAISGGSIIPQYGQFIMEYTAPALKESHDLGMEVVSSMPMILINTGDFNEAGLKYTDYCAYFPSGEAYTGGCLNNPNWRKLLYDYTMLTAQNGFDGMFCDASPYSYGPGYCCCCKYCHEAWEKYSLEKLGRVEPLPMEPPKHTTDVSRCFFDFRAQTFLDFVLYLRDEARQYNPNFNMWPNVGMNGALVMYYLNGGLDTIITEYGHAGLLECGEDSTMYMFRQYEALYEHLPLISQHNSIKEQADPPYRYYTAYAEALASGGTLMLPTAYTYQYMKVIKGYNAIIDENPDAFTKSTSIADTAVIYSMKDINAYHFRSTGLISFRANTSRRAASLLASNGIPYDYIVAEKASLSLDEIKQYKTIVVPELHLVDLKFADMLEQYVRGGGQLLILGDAFATNYIGENGYDYPAYEYDLFEKMTGTKFADAVNNAVYTCGDGRIIVDRKYADTPDNARDEATYRASTFLLADFENLGMFDQIRVTENIRGDVETTIRSDATGQRWWVHLINYGTEDRIPMEPYTAVISIPEGETVLDVIPSCAFRSLKKMEFSWEFKDGKLTVTGLFDIHTMLTICKR